MKHLPNKSCEICGGTGYVPNPDNVSQTQFCTCVIRNNALEYLGPTYRNAQILEPNKIPGDVENRNILMDGTTSNVFKTLVKTFLISTCMKYSHASVITREVIEAQFESKNSKTQAQDLLKPDLLLIFMHEDMPNKYYLEIFSALINKRTFSGKYTWIFSERKVDSTEFSMKYGKGLSEYLLSPEFWRWKIMASPKEPSKAVETTVDEEALKALIDPEAPDPEAIKKIRAENQIKLEVVNPVEEPEEEPEESNPGDPDIPDWKKRQNERNRNKGKKNWKGSKE